MEIQSFASMDLNLNHGVYFCSELVDAENDEFTAVPTSFPQGH